MESTDQLLERLPPTVRAAIVAARQIVGEDARNEQIRALNGVAEAVGFPPFQYRETVFPLPAELTPAQRAFAELCAREELAILAAMPEGSTLARWLGIERASVLEQSVTLDERTLPVWRFLQEKTAPERVLAVLPVDRQLALLAAYEGAVGAYRIPLDRRIAWKSSVTETLRGEGEAWARATLAPWTPAVVKTFSGGSHYKELSVGQGTTNLAFFALVRAGAEIDPRWDELLPFDPTVPVSVMLECAAALPFDRMERAAITVLASAWGPAAIEHGRALLQQYDSRAIAEALIAISAKSLPRHRKVEMAALLEIGNRHPNVKAAVLVAMGKAPKPIHLEVIARTQPRAASDLTEVQAAQLIAAGKRWDGKTLPVERRLSLDENDEAALGPNLEHVVIAAGALVERPRTGPTQLPDDATKKPLYEAWFYGGDSGSFFAAGTTKLVAERIQDATELRGKANEALRDALSSISFSASAIRSAADVRAATEAGAAVRAANEAPAEKPAKAKKKATKKK